MTDTMTTTDLITSARAAALAKLAAGDWTIDEAVWSSVDGLGDLTAPLQNFIGEILISALEIRFDQCLGCSGDLIGAERALGSCGNCRSKGRI